MPGEGDLLDKLEVTGVGIKLSIYDGEVLGTVLVAADDFLGEI